ncbi:aldehyde dehydrogenase family protein, partial [Gordonia sp. (in: high G+C Gram-positive bacteria)]|uniref:aldehyde dehydrogenase family protein n=1 Tax=Gordonia sp. (in: high G+C Gram-positive bacteria) TaxID=84139 RepID=UPI0026335BEE
MTTLTLPNTDDLRALAKTSLANCGVDVDALLAPAAHTVVTRTPVTGEDLFPVAAAGADDVTAAIDRAHDAYLRWRTVPGPVRGALVKRLGELLTEHKEDIGALISIEVGKITSEALGEVQEMIDI